MKTGMNLLLWTVHLTEEEYPVLAALKETGFDGVEVPVMDGDVAHFQRVRKELENQGLEATAVTAVDAEHNPASPDPAVRKKAAQRLEWAIEMTATMGADVLCGPIHSAFKTFTGRGPTEDEKTWSAEVLHRAGHAADKVGVTLMVEQLNRFECYLVNTAEACRDLLSSVDHPRVKMLYDTHHAHIEEKSVADAITASQAEIAHIHISENDRGTPGKGQVHWRDTFRSLRENDYDGWLVIESFSRLDPDFAAGIHIWRDFASSPEEVYRDGYRFIQEMWEKRGGA